MWLQFAKYIESKTLLFRQVLGCVLETEFAARFAEVVIAYPGGPAGAESVAAALLALPSTSSEVLFTRPVAI